ncbi:solute carrier family 35 (UDP-sugar transporter), member A1/2/3, partial [Phenoliferia sp. Uapishka_3]
MSVNTNPVIGTVIIARHGDRQGELGFLLLALTVPRTCLVGPRKWLITPWAPLGFYQSPTTYTATATAITPVGEAEEYQLGALLHSIYADTTSPTYITGLNTTTLTATQLNSTADGGGEGGVIFDSAMALCAYRRRDLPLEFTYSDLSISPCSGQGFYPPSSTANSISLANGSTIISPLGGYQYIQINAVLPTDDVDFEVRFGFRNGTTDGDSSGLTYYPLFGGTSNDTDLTTFVSNLEPSVLQDNLAWCTACKSTGGVCAVYAQAALANSTGNSTSGIGAHHDAVSPVGAGFIGFAVTTAVFLAALAVLASLGIVSFGAASRRRRSNHGNSVPLKGGSLSSQQGLRSTSTTPSIVPTTPPHNTKTTAAVNPASYASSFAILNSGYTPVISSPTSLAAITGATAASINASGASAKPVLSSGALIGIIAGAGALGLIILAMIFWWFWKKRKAKRDEASWWKLDASNNGRRSFAGNVMAGKPTRQADSEVWGHGEFDEMRLDEKSTWGPKEPTNSTATNDQSGGPSYPPSGAPFSSYKHSAPYTPPSMPALSQREQLLGLRPSPAARSLPPPTTSKRNVVGSDSQLLSSNSSTLPPYSPDRPKSPPAPDTSRPTRRPDQQAVVELGNSSKASKRQSMKPSKKDTIINLTSAYGNDALETDRWRLPQASASPVKAPYAPPQRGASMHAVSSRPPLPSASDPIPSQSSPPPATRVDSKPLRELEDILHSFANSQRGTLPPIPDGDSFRTSTASSYGPSIAPLTLHRNPPAADTRHLPISESSDSLSPSSALPVNHRPHYEVNHPLSIYSTAGDIGELPSARDDSPARHRSPLKPLQNCDAVPPALIPAPPALFRSDSHGQSRIDDHPLNRDSHASSTLSDLDDFPSPNPAETHVVRKVSITRTGAPVRLDREESLRLRQAKQNEALSQMGFDSSPAPSLLGNSPAPSTQSTSAPATPRDFNFGPLGGGGGSATKAAKQPDPLTGTGFIPLSAMSVDPGAKSYRSATEIYNSVHATPIRGSYTGVSSEDEGPNEKVRRVSVGNFGNVWSGGNVQLALNKMVSSVFSGDCWKLAIPACLYVVQNNLQFVAASNLDVPTFQVTYNLKILTTALFSVIMLKRKLSAKKWIALSMLAMGVGIVQLQSTAATGAGAKHVGAEMNQAKGLLAVASACMTSGLAGVYFEMVLKGSKADLWIRNIQLSLFSLVPAFVPVILPRITYLLSSSADAVKPQPIFAFFGFWAWSVVLCQVVGGLVTALVIKYADNLLKGFATALAIVFSFVAGVILFNFRVTTAFVVGTFVVVCATVLYNQPDARLPPLPQTVSHKIPATPPTLIQTTFYDPNRSPVIRSRANSPTRGGVTDPVGLYRRSPTTGAITPDLNTTAFDQFSAAQSINMPLMDPETGTERRKSYAEDLPPH